VSILTLSLNDTVLTRWSRPISEETPTKLHEHHVRSKPYTDCRRSREYRNGKWPLEPCSVKLITRDWTKDSSCCHWKISRTVVRFRAFSLDILQDFSYHHMQCACPVSLAGTDVFLSFRCRSFVVQFSLLPMSCRATSKAVRTSSSPRSSLFGESRRLISTSETFET
jgi:hypothetical protein